MRLRARPHVGPPAKNQNPLVSAMRGPASVLHALPRSVIARTHRSHAAGTPRAALRGPKRASQEKHDRSRWPAPGGARRAAAIRSVRIVAAARREKPGSPSARRRHRALCLSCPRSWRPRLPAALNALAFGLAQGVPSRFALGGLHARACMQVARCARPQRERGAARGKPNTNTARLTPLASLASIGVPRTLRRTGRAKKRGPTPTRKSAPNPTISQIAIRNSLFGISSKGFPVRDSL